MSHATTRIVRLCAVVALIIVSSLSAGEARSPAYRVRVLPLDFARAVNNHGQVVGSLNGLGALWDRKRGAQTIPPLGAFGGFGSTSAVAINHRGQVVGLTTTAESDSPHAFLRSRSGRMQDLGTLSHDPYEEAIASIATALNERGQVVGWAAVSDLESRAFVWTANAGMIDLVAPSSNANDINNRGVIVGSSNDRAVLWTDIGVWEELGTFGVHPIGQIYSYANAINDRGWVVGTSSAPSGGAFLWTRQGGLQNLGHLPFEGDSHLSTAVDINNRGTIIGTSDAPATVEPFVWTPREGMKALNELVPSGWRIYRVVAINDRDVILASANHPTYGSREVLLEPRQRK